MVLYMHTATAPYAVRHIALCILSIAVKAPKIHKMAQRKLFVLESYYEQGKKNPLWRLMNFDGLNWDENPKQYCFVRPSACRNEITIEVTKIQALLEANGDKWYVPANHNENTSPLTWPQGVARGR
jgi:hypothetical protein